MNQTTRRAYDSWRIPPNMSGQLVEQWPLKKLNEICDVSRGKTITRKETVEGDVPVVAGGINSSYSHNTANRPANVITVSGSGANAGFVNFWATPIFASDCSTILPLDPNMLDVRFVYYAMLNLQDYISKELRRGAAQPHVYAKDLALLEIPVPSLEEQQRIVSILDEAFENISNSSMRVEQKLHDSSELLQSVIHSIITPDDHNWDEFALDELTHKITKGSSPKWQGVSYIDEPGVLFVTSENVGRNQMIYKKTKFVEDKFNEIDSKSILQKGDVLTNIVGASIGRTAVFDKDDNSNINQAVCLIRCNEEKLVNKYLSYLLNSHFFVQILHDNEVNTARANLSLGFFRSLIIPVPTISEQYEIIEKLDSVYSNISKVKLALEQESRFLDELKRSILQEAFNGTL